MLKNPLVTIKIISSRILSPARIFIISFALVILIGAVLLWFPFSANKEQLTFIDALFSSASAVCVTGLTVIDIGRDLSLTGQIITIVLFQCGGLGIITFSVFFFGMMGLNVSFKGREIVQTTFLHSPKTNFYQILKTVFIFTFFIEAIGTLLLLIRFIHDFPFWQALYVSVYHAVSAFNNCGYSLLSESLTNYKGDYIINGTIIGLILLGGIGFVVLHEVMFRLRGLEKRLSVHTKIVLVTTFILVIAGAILFYFFERNHIIKGFSFDTAILVSLFQSVTARTCGFNTVDIGHLTNDTLLILTILMFIGASPGSTGGGVKTTSAAILFLMIWNRLKGNQEVNVFNRTIPREISTKTIFIIFASAFSIALITSALLFSAADKVTPIESRHLLVQYLFESVSAFGTVGLSMGVTQDLNTFQKLAVIILMFAGRVGPLTLALSLTLRSDKKTLSYAEETVMVG
ncbi:MAG: Ktr system potassium uptake protein B [Syntrophorhabdus sp. PtaU1.Bin058]|nr:MAG: Ktr system potassium uptake protein B [Syntrophorhabdus sp. PtaU1.Bin058]